MDRQELISIIIPVYNIEAYLPKCLETIAAQTYQNLEIILVNDGSTDSSGNICDFFAEKEDRAIVIHQNNQGLWAARNSGQRVAKGDYLMFVDGDDYLHLDAVRTLYQAINNNREYDIAIIDYKKTHCFDEDIESERKGEVFEVNQKQLISSLFNGDVSKNVWNKLYRKKLIKDIYANEYPRAQDYEFNIRVFLLANNAVIIRRELYFWMQRPSSFIHQPDFLDIVYPYQVYFLFENYNNIPKNRSQYGHYLLSRLYKDMVFWKNRNYGTNNESVVFGQCKKYEISTRKAYWLNWRINPLEKIVVTILLHSPRLTRWLMRVTKNY